MSYSELSDKLSRRLPIAGTARCPLCDTPLYIHQNGNGPEFRCHDPTCDGNNRRIQNSSVLPLTIEDRCLQYP